MRRIVITGLAAAAVLGGLVGGVALPAAASTPPNYEHYPYAVSCASPAMCMAVGIHLGSPLAELWNGKKWKTVPVPLPVKGSGTGTALSSVSCRSVKSCVAVGSETPNSGFVTSDVISESWNGSTWKARVVPLPAGINEFNSVSCWSASQCMTVGGTQPLGTAAPQPSALAAAWNGKTWQVLKAGGPAGATLDTVSCPAAGSCVALGNYPKSAASPYPTVNFAETWNGKTWKVTKPPVPASTGTPQPFAALSCASASRCIGVATANNAADRPSAQLAEAWTGSAWKVLATPKLAISSATGVSCLTSANCTVVGGYGSNKEYGTFTKYFTEKWNGKAWKAVTLPLPAGAAVGSLAAVSCATATNCVAVGQYGIPTGIEYGDYHGYGMSEIWNGKTWRRVNLA